MKKWKLAALAASMALLLLAAGCGGGPAAPGGGADGGAKTSSAADGGASSQAPDVSSETPGVSSETPMPPAGASALAFATTDLDGAAVDSGILAANTLTVLNVWATWCPPCVEELPELQQLSEAYADRGVQVMGVLEDGVAGGARDEAVIADAKLLLEDAGAGYTVLLPDESIQAELISTMQYFPTTFFLDAGGNVVETAIGARSFEEWSEIVDETLEKLG